MLDGAGMPVLLSGRRGKKRESKSGVDAQHCGEFASHNTLATTCSRHNAPGVDETTLVVDSSFMDHGSLKR